MALRKRRTPEINAGSMADIAFLLLFFFLVTTTLDVDSGIQSRLPPVPDETKPPADIHARNVFEIRLDASDRLEAEGKMIAPQNLRDLMYEFLTNNGKRNDLSDSPEHAVIHVETDRNATYDAYLKVQDDVRAVYGKARNEAALSEFGKDFSQLPKAQQDYLRRRIPLKLSEAEPAKE